MEIHLVSSHMGGYYVSDSPIEDIEKSCEQCFDCDTVLLTYQEGGLYNALETYITKLAYEQESLIDMLVDGDTKEELAELIEFTYDDRKTMLIDLEEAWIITKEEMNKLLEVLNNSQTIQFNILRGIDIGGYTPKMMVKRNKKKDV